MTAIVSAGIVPGAIEMMDRLSIEAAEAATNAGYRLDAGAALIDELAAEYGLQVANVFHAGDGNLHPARRRASPPAPVSGPRSRA